MARGPTMSDIARRAGVSRVAVSYALNGRAGVSPELRERILALAREMGFRPSGPAMAMHGAAAKAIGLALRRSSATLSVEVFPRLLISGIQTELSAHGFGLALQFVTGPDAEIAVYRRWSGERRVDGVLVCDLAVDDPRIAVLEDLRLPAVVVGGPDGTGGLTSLWSDDAAAVRETVGYLASLGHRRAALVSGPAGLAHTQRRTAAFQAACRSAGVDGSVLIADYTGEAGAQATRRILGSARRPSAIVYDNDVMAVAGLGVAMEMGIAVPAALSIVAGEDSALCQVVRPALTVLRRDVTAHGQRAAQLLFGAMAGSEPQSVQGERAALVTRGSTGPPPGQPG
ncbi:MAG: hypothetical protein QOI35_3184 [Cryptosporangiaceae bacterium]|nr:hypothetical protein [Cryptosporangiaceae bacterium]